MNILQVKDINLGGLSDSILQGQNNSVAEAVGLDIHSEPGVIKVNQALAKESGIFIDDLIKVMLACSDGNTYFFGSTTGKIWQRTSAGVYSLLVTAAPAAGGVGILDAWEYQGHIYYTMESRIGRVAVGAPTDFTGRNDSWATFTNTDASFHPMVELNQVLYIGDKHYVAQVDAGVFSANALDIKTPLRIKSLGRVLTDLLLGTYVNAYRVATEIFRWNTWAVSYSSEDEIPEIGINAFLKTDNFILVNAGTKGNIYMYNGAQLENYKRIPGDWTGDNAAIIHPNAVVNKFGMPLFGLSNQSGNPAAQGVYSLGGYDRNYPKVLNLEWLISTGKSTGIDIGALEMVGSTLLVSWKQGYTVTMTLAAPGVITYAAHGFSAGTPITFSTTGALPTGITGGTVYYVRSVSTDTFNIYDTAAHAIAGGATGQITTSGSQSGVHTANTYGIDALSTTAKVASSYFVMRLLNADRESGKILNGHVGYLNLPAGTSIKMYHKVDDAVVWTEQTLLKDDVHNVYYAEASFPEASTIQVKVELNSSANDAPEVDFAQFSFT